jgi:hypothetical protein
MSTNAALPGELDYLTYFSVATQRFNQSELKRLLEVSRRKNAPLGITGLLLYRDGHFLQYLEGPIDAVQATYDRIRTDKRHELPRIVASGSLRGRIFPEWWMGYKNLAGIRAENTDGYSECLQANFRPSAEGDPAERLTDLLYELVARNAAGSGRSDSQFSRGLRANQISGLR